MWPRTARRWKSGCAERERAAAEAKATEQRKRRRAQWALAASVLMHATCAASVIADGVHVHPRMLQLAARLLGPDRMLLVTDAVAWRAGTVGAIGMELRDGAPRLPDGTLAGSAVTMDAAVRMCVDAGIDLEHALVAASTVPARLLGLRDRGVIAPGRRADLVLLSPGLEVEATLVAGRQP